MMKPMANGLILGLMALLTAAPGVAGCGDGGQAVMFSTEPASVSNRLLGIVGAVEMVGIVDTQYVLPARIDTGAATSSIHALDIEQFARGGNSWVRFVVPGPQGATRRQLLEKPLKRMVGIKRHGAGSQQRAVVELQIVMGTHSITREFSLADRSGFEYPVLIGRNVLAGQAVVDSAREYVLTTEPRE